MCGVYIVAKMTVSSTIGPYLVGILVYMGNQNETRLSNKLYWSEAVWRCVDCFLASAERRYGEFNL